MTVETLLTRRMFNYTPQIYTGLAADTKPTSGVKPLDEFMETDTGDVYKYYGSAIGWKKIVDGGFPGTTLLTTLYGEDPTNNVMVTEQGQFGYETVAASQTAQVLGATGAAGNFIHSLWAVPATTSPGAVSLLDNATSITIFTGGASSVADLKPFKLALPEDGVSASGAWKITTGADISVIASGRFT